MTQLKNLYVLGNRYCSLCQKSTSEQWCDDGHDNIRTRAKPTRYNKKTTMLEAARKNKHRVCHHRRVSKGRRMLFSSI